MNSKQRVLYALNREKSDRVPFNFWMDRRLMERYENKIGHRHWRVTHYGADVIETFPCLKFPTGRMENKTGTSWLTEPLFEDWRDADSLILPDASEDQVYERIQRDLREFPDTAVFLDVPTAWGIIAKMVGYENIYVDMYDHRDEFHNLCRRITDIQKQVVERACRIGITALYIMEDVSTTRGPSMSPAMIQEYCLNYAAELRAVADSYEIPTLFHCCGKITDELADMFVNLGVKAINPLQPSVNVTEEFAKKYSDRLAVYGGIDNCFTIPNGTPEQVREHIDGQFRLLGKPFGGLILSSHDIDIDTPDENIDAMVTAIKNCNY